MTEFFFLQNQMGAQREQKNRLLTFARERAFATLAHCQSLLVVSILLVLTGCASQNTGGSYQLNESLKATGKNSRIDIIVLHYTASSKPSALLTLTNREVSAHYVVSDDSKPVVYKLVDENLSAWPRRLAMKAASLPTSPATKKPSSSSSKPSRRPATSRVPRSPWAWTALLPSTTRTATITWPVKTWC